MLTFWPSRLHQQRCFFDFRLAGCKCPNKGRSVKRRWTATVDRHQRDETNTKCHRQNRNPRPRRESHSRNDCANSFLFLMEESFEVYLKENNDQYYQCKQTNENNDQYWCKQTKENNDQYWCTQTKQINFNEAHYRESKRTKCTIAM